MYLKLYSITIFGNCKQLRTAKTALQIDCFCVWLFQQHFKRILRHVSLYTILGTCWVLFMAQNIFNFCQVFTLAVKKSLIGQYFLFLYALYLWYRLFVSLIRRPRKSTEIKFYCNKSMFRFKILQLMKVRFVQFSPVRVHYDSFRATQVISKFKVINSLV